MNVVTSELNFIHIILAYAGLLIYVLVKLQDESLKKGFTFGGFINNRTNLLSLLISVVSIPVILLMATDPSIKELLPINNVTSVLAGWQTNSVFRSLMSVYESKLNKANSNNN